MAQQTLNDPLDGAEKKSIILKRISDALDRDCTLGDDIAHAGFKVDFTISIKYLRTVAGAETVVWGSAVVGDIPIGDNVVTATATGTYETDSPNAAREDHDLGIPVMVATPSGTERRKIKIARPLAKTKAQSESVEERKGDE